MEVTLTYVLASNLAYTHACMHAYLRLHNICLLSLFYPDAAEGARAFRASPAVEDLAARSRQGEGFRPRLGVQSFRVWGQRVGWFGVFGRRFKVLSYRVLGLRL